MRGNGIPAFVKKQLSKTMKIKFDLNSLKFKLWLYFAVMSLLVVGLIWLLQSVFLNQRYEDMKIAEVNRVGAQMCASFNSGDENFTSKVEMLSVSSDMYVMMESYDTVLVFAPDQESARPVYKYRNELPHLKEMLEECDPGVSVNYTFSTSNEQYNTFVYANRVMNPEGIEAILYIFSPLYPVASTVSILKNQLLNVTIIAMLLAFLLALYFSGRIAKPIKAMTATAKQMSTGDYNVKYNVSSYTEVNTLADTLNMTAYELGKQDERQKDLIANVSHDLKTPLTIIRSYAEMIRDLSGDNPEKRNNHLDIIMKESDRMSNLVSDMSLITAMQTKSSELDLGYFDLAKLTEETLAAYDIYREQEGYDYQFNPPKDGATVYGDEKKIKQVVANLISNATKYCGEDKTVIINIKKTGRKYRFEVSDHGPGISQEDLPHIWDRYYKASSNYVRPAEGTGLGLSIVKEILTRHYAKYGVVSKLGKGTTFWFELDMTKPQ